MTYTKYLSDIRENFGNHEAKEVQRIYRDVKSDFQQFGIRNGKYMNNIALIRTQAIYSGLVDEKVFDDKEIKTAKRLQNFSEKYGYDIINRFLSHQIDYNQLKKEIEDLKYRNEKYMKETYV